MSTNHLIKRHQTDSLHQERDTEADFRLSKTEMKKYASKASVDEINMRRQLNRIANHNGTEFQKKVWTLLCQIPHGSFSTYGLLAKYLKSSPRAVGNALSHNPFSPEVPCHRVVATNRGLGGFRGSRPHSGIGVTLDEKRQLLVEEGVRFDEEGKVIGTPFSNFQQERGGDRK